MIKVTVSVKGRESYRLFSSLEDAYTYSQGLRVLAHQKGIAIESLWVNNHCVI